MKSCYYLVEGSYSSIEDSMPFTIQIEDELGIFPTHPRFQGNRLTFVLFRKCRRQRPEWSTDPVESSDQQYRAHNSKKIRNPDNRHQEIPNFKLCDL
ncbi:hypothetical protein AVEN_202293-1 [Araneus ventricosus]|uniref:Uncharacterized protein n=1 Tax=Araneus ventricosus TaxID=182803 RepID=A0A4Y2VEQ5_ARAVE|nr:hypothetical protein AVEN_202293-1 [Araneus ventricosus]